eukprot:TRINITY_DN5304_c0_g1_i1.p1 TRINITY_DN5304_c0_g1~~TRINITY_DN5304_c0_g1_i1.p1  ORF type:complete len:246 (-),score=16.86 TRINITY_DN5304_c0_g1_i1:125-862(-)
MICVECGKPVNDLYKSYGTGAAAIRLTLCQYCNRTADKYVEYDQVLVFLDLFLHRPQAYRHLLFNKMDYHEKGIDIQYIKVFVVYIFFEAYIKWLRFREYCQYQVPKTPLYDYQWQDDLPPDRYFFILGTSLAEYLVFILAVCAAVKIGLGRRYAIVKYNYLAMALILSSFGKGLLVFMMVWDYQLNFASWLSVFVFTSNVVALKVFLDSNTFWASVFVVVGFLCRRAFQSLVDLITSPSLLCII